jgi:hypothetical protein
MKLSLINESLTSEEMQILDAWNRGEIEKGDNLYDSAQDLFKKLGIQVMLSESAPDLKELKKHRQILDDEEKSKAKKLRLSGAMGMSVYGNLLSTERLGMCLIPIDYIEPVKH